MGSLNRFLIVKKVFCCDNEVGVDGLLVVKREMSIVTKGLFVVNESFFV